MPEIVERQPEATFIPGAIAPPAASVPDAQKPADEAPAAGETPPETAKPSTEEQPAKQGKNRFERRLDRAYRREAEAKARADLFEKQLNELKAKLEPATPTEGEPRLDQFDDIEKYAAAKSAFREKKAVEAFQANQNIERAKAAQTALAGTWEEKADKGSEKYDDFHDVVGDLRPTNPLTAAIIKAPNGEDIAYHLGKDLKEATRIASLEPIEQILAIGELSAKLMLSPPKAQAPSKAPAPINPVSGKSTPVSSEPSESDDYKTWLKKRQKQVHSR